VVYANKIYSCHAYFEFTVTGELSTDYIEYAFYIFGSITFFRTLVKKNLWIKGFFIHAFLPMHIISGEL
jgi:hypothetical protein